jgi:CheY-like chemotaxis protein
MRKLWPDGSNKRFGAASRDENFAKVFMLLRFPPYLLDFLVRGPLLAIVLASVGTIGGNPANAQDDPFGVAPAPPAAAPKARAGAGNDARAAQRVLDASNPIISEIRKRAVLGPVGLGEAINKFMQIGRIDLAVELLQQLAAKPVPDADASAIVSQVTDARMFQLRMSSELTVAQKQVVEQLQIAAAKYARDPERVKGLVPLLAANDDVARRAAERELLRADNAGIVAVVAELLSPTATVPVPVIANHLQKYETKGAAAVERAAHDSTGTTAIKTLEALTIISPTQALPTLITSLYAKDANAELRQAAILLSRQYFQTAPTFDQAERLLTQRLEQEIIDWRKTPYGGESLTGTWVTAAPETVAYQEMTLRESRAIRAFMAAERLARIKKGTPIDLVMAADLAGQFSLNPNFGLTAEDLSATVKRWGIPAEEASQALENTLEKARELRIAEAAVAAIRLLAKTADRNLTVAAGPRPRPLVAAVDDAIPAIRLEAAGAIAELGIVQEFAGSSAVVRRWQELREMPTQPQALLIEPRESVAQDLVLWLEFIGYQVTWAKTGWVALDEIERHANFDFAVISSRPSDSGPIEMIDRVRRYPKGGALPMLVVGPTENEKGMGLQQVEDVKHPSVWLPTISNLESLKLIHDDLFGNPVSRSFDSEVLIVDSRTEEVRRLTPMLQGIGYTVRDVPIAPDALNILSKPNNVGLILVSSKILDRELFIFAERIRQNPRTVATPIVVYGPHPYAAAREIVMTETWDAPTAWVTRVDSMETLRDLRNRLTQQETAIPLEIADRERLRNHAQRALSK